MGYRYSTMSTNRLRTLPCLVLVTLSVLAAWPAWSQVSSFPVNTPKQVATGKAKLVGPYNPSSMLRLAISIKAPKMAEEEKFLKELQDRNSPNFHKYLTPEQWNARFAPAQQDFTSPSGERYGLTLFGGSDAIG